MRCKGIKTNGEQCTKTVKSGYCHHHKSQAGTDVTPSSPTSAPAPAPAPVPPRTVITMEDTEKLAKTLAGRTVGSMGGCFCPPHRGHYETFRDVIKEYGLDVLFIQSINRDEPERSRHGTPVSHSHRALTMYARQLEHEFGGQVQVYIAANSSVALFEWIPASITVVYDITIYDDAKAVREPKPINVLSRRYFKELHPAEYQHKYRGISLVRTGGLSATKFSKCLAHYQQSGKASDLDECRTFISHLSEPDQAAYLEDILQYDLH